MKKRLIINLVTLFFSTLILIQNLFAQDLKEVTKNGNKTVILNGISNNKNDKTLDIKEILSSNKKIEEKSRKSIMLTKEELKGVRDSLNAFRNNAPLSDSNNDESDQENIKKDVKPINEQSMMYLDAILYISRNSWIVWANGKKITSRDNDPQNPIYIKYIDNSKADILWKIGISKWQVITGKQDVDESIYYVNKGTNQVELNFTLRTNQSYDLLSNQVIEGRVR